LFDAGRIAFAARLQHFSTLRRIEGNDRHGHYFQDLTEVRALEETSRRQDRLAAVGRVAAGIAHEIRNPLASMRGSIQVLRSEIRGDSGQAELMEIILRESDRLNRIITDF
jgi:two-component system sensor histidine kinase PilS (NtrC family)